MSNFNPLTYDFFSDCASKRQPFTVLVLYQTQRKRLYAIECSKGLCLGTQKESWGPLIPRNCLLYRIVQRQSKHVLAAGTPKLTEIRADKYLKPWSGPYKEFLYPAKFSQTPGRILLKATTKETKIDQPKKNSLEEKKQLKNCKRRKSVNTLAEGETKGCTKKCSSEKERKRKENKGIDLRKTGNSEVFFPIQLYRFSQTPGRILLKATTKETKIDQPKKNSLEEKKQLKNCKRRKSVNTLAEGETKGCTKKCSSEKERKRKENKGIDLYASEGGTEREERVETAERVFLPSVRMELLSSSVAPGTLALLGLRKWSNSWPLERLWANKSRQSGLFSTTGHTS
ncbi:hypothetical protein WH47_06174 [Habropoda laboriosa]|uniref:Uncharacterized protein n=1 Tax=Habropoda laboriosa TaxID=597456 RepID=A0A0L7QS25_9HYME|nr:hypothetical protein WH47_06174 [Habropoda laboriosa]